MSVARATVLLGGTGLGAVAAYRYQQVVQREKNLPSQQIEAFTLSPTTTTTAKQIIVIGGGVVGITTAYKLAQQGHSVALLEPRSKPGQECSKCAAGGMQRSNPVVDRGSWIAVTKCIAPLTAKLIFGGNEESFKFFRISWLETLSDPFFLRWVLTFTKTSLLPGKEQEHKQKEMLDFTKYAVDHMVEEMMENPRDSMAKASGYNPRGSFTISYDPVKEEEVSKAKAEGNPTSSKMNYEPSRPVVGEDVFEEEPSLKFQQQAPTSAKYGFQSKAASSERFTLELASRCEKDPKLDVHFLYNTEVKAITVDKSSSNTNEKPRITELRTNRGVIPIPKDVKVVVAAGAWTPRVMALMDLFVPVYPLKGYAMSVSATDVLKANPNLKAQDLPSRIVSDKYMYTSRLGDEIRITSIGEFSGWSTQPMPEVDAEFRREAKRQFPQLEEFIDMVPTYCGHRPFVNDGILLLGQVDTHENLFVSVGPGSNGWKLAMGSGEVIERLVNGQSTDQIAQELGFDPSAFSPAGRILYAPFFAKLCRAYWNV